ncbi:hypothetical protein [Pedobacter sp. P26]|uniref:hypothetical protein n=1 Tax=Pedobacter sp. P26 TaxID=3423956 RepID=UPI003D67696F
MKFENIKLIIVESFRWRNRNLLENRNFVDKKISFLILIKKNFSQLVFGIFLSVLFRELINKDFAANMVTALSIFVGLFTTTLILIFDKYISHYKIEDKAEAAMADLSEIPSDLEVNLLRTKNFSKRFVYVSLESLLIAILLIMILLIPLMMGNIFSDIDLLDYKFEFQNLNLVKIKIFSFNFLVFITRVVLYVLLINYFTRMFYVFGALGEYIKGVFDDKIKPNI